MKTYHFYILLGQEVRACQAEQAQVRGARDRAEARRRALWQPQRPQARRKPARRQVGEQIQYQFPFVAFGIDVRPVSLGRNSNCETAA